MQRERTCSMRILLVSLMVLSAVSVGTIYAETLDTEIRLFQWRSIQVNAGYDIAFSGNLKDSSGNPIPHAEILIRVDGVCPDDGLIASGITDAKGRYFIMTEAMHWDPDGLVRANAVFFGDTKYSPSESRDQLIVVFPSAHGKSCY